MTKFSPGRLASLTYKARAGLLAALFMGVSVLASGLCQAASTAQPWESLYSVTRNPSGTWFIVGSRGAVLTSNDEGVSWQREHPLSDRDLYSIAFDQKGDAGWIVGENGRIFRTNDGGKSWERQTSPVKFELLKIAVVDANTACAVGDDGALLNTTDGGKTWQSQNFKDRTFFDLTMLGSEGWAVGEFQTILHTVDGCKTWQPQKVGAKSYMTDPYFTVIFKDNQHGWVTGLGGSIFATADGGKTWTESKLPSADAAIYSIVLAPDGSDLFLAGKSGSMMQVKDDLTGWQTSDPTYNDLAAVTFSPHLGLAVGMNGTILRSTNNGKAWQVAGGQD